MTKHEQLGDQLVWPAEGVPTGAGKPAVSVIGLGYVGAVSCACLCDLGHRVIGADIDTSKVSMIDKGESPIHEKDLGLLLSAGIRDELLSATTDAAQAVEQTDVTFLSVGTPTAADGGCDFRFIRAAARDIGRGLARKSGYHVVVMRCSVPPGSTMEVMAPIIEEVSGRRVGVDFGICFNPEFMREGVAVDDFRKPPKTVIGTTDARSAEIVAGIFAPVDANPIICSVADAELVKYVDNVWHATKVCFANEVGRLAKSYGVDGHSVMSIFVRDRKLNISDHYLKPGFAYGGSCLPKEVRAVTHLARARSVDLPLIGSLGASNDSQIREAVRLARDTGARRIAVLGVAFKPGTDDLRESPILEVMADLLEDGLDLAAHDHAITPQTNIAGQMAYVAHGAPSLVRLAERLPGLLTNDLDEALDGAEAVIVTHRDPSYAAALSNRPDLPVVDVVRLFDAVPGTPAYRGIGW